MQDENIDDYAECLAEAFKGYALFEYFSGGKYDVEKMKTFWEVSIRASQKNILVISADEKASSVLLLYKNCFADASITDYMKAEGLKIISALGIRNVTNMLKFESFAGKIKRKYATENCAYLYAFGTRPEMSGKGYGSAVLKAVLAYLDKSGTDCYLETLKETNVPLYEHFGFELKETASVPKTDLTIYAMLRKHK